MSCSAKEFEVVGHGHLVTLLRYRNRDVVLHHPRVGEEPELRSGEYGDVRWAPLITWAAFEAAGRPQPHDVVLF